MPCRSLNLLDYSKLMILKVIGRSRGNSGKQKDNDAKLMCRVGLGTEAKHLARPHDKVALSLQPSQLSTTIEHYPQGCGK